MKAPARLGAFGLALGVVFAGTYGFGTFIGPLRTVDAADHSMARGGPTADHEAQDSHGANQAAGSGPGGLAVSAAATPFAR